ncbi:hypothetical protein [Salinimonas lutimaris]|uniref:hypothetical protein n=1 Tax=Salinimonas lutimaris TaxID=914153 RepID=UPI0010C0AB2C|nr:hypothetical protein [Salinimonas lutimaris]
MTEKPGRTEAGASFPAITALSLQLSERIYLGAFLTLLVWLPLPLGSATSWGWLAVMLLLALLNGLYINQHREYSINILVQNRWVMGFWGLLSVWHFLLLIPFSSDLLESVRPLRNHVIFTDRNDWQALTYSTQDTLLSLYRTVTYWGMFTLTLLLFRSSRRLKLLLRAFVAIGLFEILYASLLIFIDADHSLILDLPLQNGATGTFLRQIAYGHTVFLAICAVLGLLIIRIKPSSTGTLRQKLRRVIKYFFSKKAALRIAALLLFGGMVMAGIYSMAWVTLIATLTTALAAYWLFSPRPKLFTTFMGSLLAANIAAVIVATFLSDRAGPPPPPAPVTLEDAQWQPATPDVMEHWVLGAGPGTAKDVEIDGLFNLPVPGVIPLAQRDTYQAVAEFGLPVSVLALVLFAWCAGHALLAMHRRRHVIFRGTAFSCVAALTGTGLLTIYESPLQTPSNAAYVSVLLALSLVCLQCRKYYRA